MPTISRHWPAVRSDFQSLCDYCGVQWRRSQLVRDRAGLMACPDDVKGRDVVTLTQGNALSAAKPQYTSPVRDGGNFDNSGPTKPGGVYITEGDDI